MNNDFLFIKNKTVAKELFQKYKEFVDKFDLMLQKLNELHQDNINCKIRCSSCCKVDRSVNLIEAKWLEKHYSRLSLEKQTLIQNEIKNLSKCPLLINNNCMLYNYRPVLCRSHGLPLIYRENGQPGISFCELNFKNIEIEFTPDNTIDMDCINAELIQIDQNWVQNALNIKWNAQRIKIRDLINSSLEF